MMFGHDDGLNRIARIPDQMIEGNSLQTASRLMSKRLMLRTINLLRSDNHTKMQWPN
jgi:hypothetical protein